MLPRSTPGEHLFITPTPNPLPAGTRLLVEATAQYKPNRVRPLAKPFRLIYRSPTAGSGPFDVITPYNARFGHLTLGNILWLRLTVCRSSGERSAQLITAVSVTYSGPPPP